MQIAVGRIVLDGSWAAFAKVWMACVGEARDGGEVVAED